MQKAGIEYSCNKEPDMLIDKTSITGSGKLSLYTAVIISCLGLLLCAVFNKLISIETESLFVFIDSSRFLTVLVICDSLNPKGIRSTKWGRHVRDSPRRSLVLS